MAVFMNIARIIGAGPLMVIDTEVLGALRSKPEYSFFMSSSVAMLTPELPILQKMSGRGAGSSPYRVTESNAVDRRVAAPPWQIGRAHVCTPVTNAHIVCRLLLEKKKRQKILLRSISARTR